MAIEAPISKFKKNNLKIYIVVCIAIAVWCAYDGYFNETWIQEHTDAEGNPETYLVFNRNAPYYFISGAILLGVYLYLIRNKKLVADENRLTVGKLSISYDSIEKIDKTHFDSKGFFIITYKDSNGSEAKYKVSDRNYDNLGAVLEHLVAQIT